MSALTQTLIDEIKSAPETVQQEVFDFLVFLKTKDTARDEGRENLLPLAHTAWGPDWDTPAEVRHGAICKRRRGRCSVSLH